jgi:hypothetical protein
VRGGCFGDCGDGMTRYSAGIGAVTEREMDIVFWNWGPGIGGWVIVTNENDERM